MFASYSSMFVVSVVGDIDSISWRNEKKEPFKVEADVGALWDRFFESCDYDILTIPIKQVLPIFKQWLEGNAGNSIWWISTISKLSLSHMYLVIEDNIINFGLFYWISRRAKFWSLIRSCQLDMVHLNRELDCLCSPRCMMERFDGCLTACDAYKIDDLVGNFPKFHRDEFIRQVALIGVIPVALPKKKLKIPFSAIAPEFILFNRMRCDKLFDNIKVEAWFLSINGKFVWVNSDLNISIPLDCIKSFALGIFFDLLPQLCFQTLGEYEWVEVVSVVLQSCLIQKIREEIKCKREFMSFSHIVACADGFVEKKKEFIKCCLERWVWSARFVSGVLASDRFNSSCARYSLYNDYESDEWWLRLEKEFSPSVSAVSYLMDDDCSLYKSAMVWEGATGNEFFSEEDPIS